MSQVQMPMGRYVQMEINLYFYAKKSRAIFSIRKPPFYSKSRKISKRYFIQYISRKIIFCKRSTVATYEADEANALDNCFASKLPWIFFSPQMCLNLASGNFSASNFATVLPQLIFLPQACLIKCLGIFNALIFLWIMPVSTGWWLVYLSLTISY